MPDKIRAFFGDPTFSTSTPASDGGRAWTYQPPTWKQSNTAAGHRGSTSKC